MRLGETYAPKGLRIYAIGDVHGCDRLLAEMHEKIADDLAVGTAESYRIIHLGDYVDRGPETAAVIERLSRLAESDDRVLCLRGNHEEMLLDFLWASPDSGYNFLANGGPATLASYGIAVGQSRSSPLAGGNLAELFAANLPNSHRAFIENLPYFASFGDYFFCHAGVRPGVALDRQDAFDLTWIREGFLDIDSDFGAVVVHGHTPAHGPEVRSNRINVDTGAVLGGPLTCVVLEGNEHRFIQVAQ
jgi:serine/threonine protein phosphatase 1